MTPRPQLTLESAFKGESSPSTSLQDVQLAWRGEEWRDFCTSLHASYLLDEYIRSNGHGMGRQELL